MQKLPLQPPYYDMAPSESTPFTDKPVSSDAMSGFKRSFSMNGSCTAAAFGPVVIAGERANSLCRYARRYLRIDLQMKCGAVMLPECH